MSKLTTKGNKTGSKKPSTRAVNANVVFGWIMFWVFMFFSLLSVQAFFARYNAGYRKVASDLRWCISAFVILLVHALLSIWANDSHPTSRRVLALLMFVGWSMFVAYLSARTESLVAVPVSLGTCAVLLLLASFMGLLVKFSLKRLTRTLKFVIGILLVEFVLAIASYFSKNSLVYYTALGLGSFAVTLLIVVFTALYTQECPSDNSRECIEVGVIKISELTADLLSRILRILDGLDIGGLDV